MRDSGTKRPPKSPKRPSSSGRAMRLSPLIRPSSRRAPRRRGRRPPARPGRHFRVGPPGVADEVPQQQRVLAARRRLHPGGHVDPGRAQAGHRRPDVVRSQPAAHDQAVVVGHPLGQPPVEHLPRARVFPVHHEEVGAELLEASDRPLARPEHLDHGAHPGAHPFGLLGGLLAVQLGRTQAGRVHGLDHPLRRLVAKHPHGQDVLGQPLGDVAGEVDRDLPRARGRT